MLIGLVHSALLKGQAINNTAVKFSARTTSSSQVNPSPDLVDGFIGQTRTVGTDFDWFINTNSGNFVKASTTPPGHRHWCIFVMVRVLGKNASRIATYHYGPALNLATLERACKTPYSLKSQQFNYDPIRIPSY